MLRLAEAAKATPPGELFDIEHGRFHVIRSGVGIPVIFEGGAGEWSAHWMAVRESLGKGFQFIAYDRLGLGWSTPTSRDRRAETLSDELVWLTNALGLDELAILVGHSFGASIVRLAASKVPSLFRGIVFVDGWHEAFAEWEERTGLASNSSLGARLVSQLDRFGFFRALNSVLNKLSPPKCPWKLPAAVWHEMLDISQRKSFAIAVAREADHYSAGDQEVSAVTHLDVPIVVLVARETVRREQMPTSYPVEEHNAAWRAASAKLASLSDCAELRMIAGTDHQI